MFETFDRHERQRSRGAGEGRRAPSTLPSSSKAVRSRSATRCTACSKEIMRRHIIDQGIAPRRPQAHRSAPHLVRSRRAAPYPRQRRVHPRRDAGHDRDHAGLHVLKSRCWTASAPRTASAICTTTTCPGYSTGEAKPHAQPRPPRDRPRRAGGARSAARDSLRGGVPLLPAAGVARSCPPTAPLRMASVCGSTLALMDAGVPIKRPVAGVAMGLIKDAEKPARWPCSPTSRAWKTSWATWTSRSPAPLRASPPSRWTSRSRASTEAILRQALAQAYDGRMHILDKMLEALPAPREHLSQVRAEDRPLHHQSREDRRGRRTRAAR